MRVANSLHLRVLRAAAQIVGSNADLRRRLQVPAAELSRWLEGEAPAPRHVFLRAVDILVTAGQQKHIGESAVHRNLAPRQALLPRSGG